MSIENSAPPRWRVLLAFAIVYVVWGSSYLAIRISIETMPPFLMAGARFVAAGLILMLWSIRSGVPRPTATNWKAAAITGALMFLVANGGVTWAEQYVPSSVAALMSATIPLWIVLIEWLRLGGTRPGMTVFAGMALGFGGIVLLVGPPPVTSGDSSLYTIGVLLLCITPLGWAIGSLMSRRSDLPASSMQTTGMQLLSGGVMLLALGVITGEIGMLDFAAISLRSWLAFAYLAVVASLITFSAYIWLLRVEKPARVSTYAFVNPLVAVLLGATIGAEPITVTTLIATAAIVAGVVLITTFKGQARPALRLRPAGKSAH